MTDEEEIEYLELLEQDEREKVSPKLELFRNPRRIKIARGGRGAGAKSWSFASLLVQKLNFSPLQLACLREVQLTLEESVWKLIRDTIDRLKYTNWVITKEYIDNPRIGSHIIFRGISTLRADQLKSLEGFDIVWMEEADKISEHSLDVILPTLRKPGSELWASLNPEQDQDPIIRRFSTRDDATIIDLLPGPIDNPWWTNELQKEMDEDFKRDPDLAEHIWNGSPRKQGDYCVMARSDIRAAMDRDIPGEGAIEIGVDVARFGDDSTQMYKRKGLKIIAHREMHKASTSEVSKSVIDFSEENREIRIKIDEGYNPGVVDMVRDDGYNVVGVNFGGSPDNKDRYANAVSEMWFECPIATAEIPNDEELMRQLAGRRYLYDKQGRKMVEPKEAYKKRNSGKSPDKADALLLCFYESMNRSNPEIGSALAARRAL